MYFTTGTCDGAAASLGHTVTGNWPFCFGSWSENQAAWNAHRANSGCATFDGTSDSGDTGWMLAATTLVMLQTPAMGLAQAGMIRRKNSLSILMQTVTGMIIGSILWFLFGYSFVFPSWGLLNAYDEGKRCDAHAQDCNNDGFLGDFEHGGYSGVLQDKCVGTIPMPLFATFQMMFALMTPVIITGAWAEKMPFMGTVLFFTIWPILSYYPIAHQVWGGGWLFQRGVMDFAGGITIHTNTGIAALVVGTVLKKRKDLDKIQEGYHNIPLFVVGASLIWAGWYGFNGGSGLMADGLASVALTNTHIAACVSGTIWVCIAYFNDHQFHVTEIFNGALAGLAGVTPASGFVHPWAAFLIGAIVGVFSYYFSRFRSKKLSSCDDVLDVASLQGIPGITGSLLVGLLATQDVNPNASTGAFYYQSKEPENVGRYTFWWQLCAVVYACVWSGVMTYATLMIIKFIGNCFGEDYLQVSDEQYEKGLDESEYGDKAYVEMGEDKKKVDDLFQKVLGGSVEDAREIVESGVSVVCKDYDLRTPLHVAALNQKREMTQYLLENGSASHVNAKDKFDRTPLSDALNSKNPEMSIEIVKLLIAKGASWEEAGVGETLVKRVADGDRQEVLFLTDKRLGLDVNVTDYDYRTALHLACSLGQKDMVEILLNANANPNSTDRWGNTPLDDAEMHEHDEIREFLMKRGAKKNTVKTNAQEVCELAAIGNLKKLKELEGASFALGDYDKRTPLHLAASEGHGDVVEFLIAKGAIVNAKDRFGNTPLLDAVTHNKPNIVHILKKNQATLPEDRIGEFMCKSGSVGDKNALQLMKDAGGSMVFQAGDYDSRTALHLAASEGHWRCVRFILQNGGQASVQDRFGRVPLQDAVDGKHKSCQDELEGYFLINGDDYKTNNSMFGKIKTARDLEMEKALQRKDTKSINDKQDYASIYARVQTQAQDQAQPSNTNLPSAQAAPAPSAPFPPSSLPPQYQEVAPAAAAVAVIPGTKTTAI